MKPTLSPRIKICCISSVQEAHLAISYGASALGLVSEMPSGPGVISEPLIQEIAARVPPPIATFLLTSKQDITEIIDQQRRCATNTIQICDWLLTGSYEELRLSLPGISLVQVIHVQDENSLSQALSVAPYVDAILLDSGNQALAIKELGGTGRTHNWEISRQIREQLSIPIFLAGGLNPDNIAEAIETVAPFGLDICSGVRTNGQLDEAKLASFFTKVQKKN